MNAGPPTDEPAERQVLGAPLSAQGLPGRGIRWLRRRLTGRPDRIEVLDVRAPAHVVAYFGDGMSKVYQLEQWLPALEKLAEARPVVVVVRYQSTARWLVERTTLRVVYVRTLRQLMDLYESHDYKAAIYVNHGRANFQSLIGADLLHVHVNHGESDKRSSYSNQARAYNRVFVAGDNAAARYRERVLELDPAVLVPIGRPQLDVAHEPALPPSSFMTIGYTPTWEGDLEDNNWTSLDVMGPAVVAALLQVPGARVVYKPHPRIRTTTSPAVADADREVRRLIDRAARAHPDAGHTVLEGVDVLALLPSCDALVVDVSTVALDYLYLCPDRPLFLTDRRTDRPRLLQETPLAGGVDVLDLTTIASLAEDLRARLADDVRRADRAELRRSYFGDLRPGESTARFVAAVGEVCAERDRLVAGRSSTRRVEA